MYLAEDRILCWELVAKRGDAWVLKYVKVRQFSSSSFPDLHTDDAIHVQAAKGETDVPDTAAEFISQVRRFPLSCALSLTYPHSFRPHILTRTPFPSPQRRRWLNGSFFAGVYALSHTLQIFGTQHSKKKKVFLLGQVVYNFVNVLFAWLGLSCVLHHGLPPVEAISDSSFLPSFRAVPTGSSSWFVFLSFFWIDRLADGSLLLLGPHLLP
jgi:chitin synthase